jgi:hypothetical protein
VADRIFELMTTRSNSFAAISTVKAQNLLIVQINEFYDYHL